MDARRSPAGFLPSSQQLRGRGHADTYLPPPAPRARRGCTPTAADPWSPRRRVQHEEKVCRANPWMQTHTHTAAAELCVPLTTDMPSVRARGPRRPLQRTETAIGKSMKKKRRGGGKCSCWCVFRLVLLFRGSGATAALLRGPSGDSSDPRARSRGASPAAARAGLTVRSRLWSVCARSGTCAIRRGRSCCSSGGDVRRNGETSTEKGRAVGVCVCGGGSTRIKGNNVSVLLPLMTFKV